MAETADLIARLEATGAERLRSTANEKDRYMNVVARLSREDGALMNEAAVEIARLTAERDEVRAMFDECAIARDASAFLGTVPECIAHWEASATENEKRAEAAEMARDEALGWAKDWHRICDTICTVLDLGALDSDQIAGAVRDKFDALTQERDEAQERADYMEKERNKAAHMFSDRVRMCVEYREEVEAAEAKMARLDEECQASMREIAAGRERAEMAERERDEARKKSAEHWRRLRRLWDRARGYDPDDNEEGPRCRDCADEDGRCPHSGFPCDPQEEAEERIVKLFTRAEAADSKLAEAMKALGPFATFSAFATERTEDGWVWSAAYGRERIQVWFGPSDFGIAADIAKTEGC